MRVLGKSGQRISKDSLLNSSQNPAVNAGTGLPAAPLSPQDSLLDIHGWESNPSSSLLGGTTGFEDRADHQVNAASSSILPKTTGNSSASATSSERRSNQSFRELVEAALAVLLEAESDERCRKAFLAGVRFAARALKTETNP